MTQSEWLASSDPAAMLRWLGGNGEIYSFRWSERRRRLFACACCRAIWPQLTDERSRQAVEAAERLADGKADREECVRAFHAADKYYIECVEGGEPGYSPPRLLSLMTRDTIQAHARVSIEYTVPRGSKCGLALERMAGILRDLVGNPFRPVTLPLVDDCHTCGGTGRFHVGSGEDAEVFACRCCPWLTPTVLSLATATYEDRLPDGTLDPARLAILSDALEEAGCDNEDILAHLRSPGPHYRGMWSLDLILGRE